MYLNYFVLKDKR